MTITVALRPEDQQRLDRATQAATGISKAVSQYASNILLGYAILAVAIVAVAVITRRPNGGE